MSYQKEFKGAVEENYNYARGLGFRSTPTFLISQGELQYDQANKNWIQTQLSEKEKIKYDFDRGWVLVGAQKFDTFQKIIDSELPDK